MSAPKWNEEFELTNGSYFISYIQDFFEYMFKNMRKKLLILQLECIEIK